MSTANRLIDEMFKQRSGEETAYLAKALLDIQFSPRATARMRQLLLSANSRDLTSSEQSEIDAYREVGMLLDLLQAKARVRIPRDAGVGEGA